MPSPEATIPIEEFEELHMKLEETENKVDELESELAIKESTIAKLSELIFHLFIVIHILSLSVAVNLSICL